MWLVAGPPNNLRVCQPPIATIWPALNAGVQAGTIKAAWPRPTAAGCASQPLPCDARGTATFPPRISGGWQASGEEQPGSQMQQQLDEPLTWVPDEGQEASQAPIAPSRSQGGKRSTLPLEFFDSPAMEAVDPQQRLQAAQAAGEPGAAALSRFYGQDGTFVWAACHVLQYDRCVACSCILPPPPPSPRGGRGGGGVKHVIHSVAGAAYFSCTTCF